MNFFLSWRGDEISLGNAEAQRDYPKGRFGLPIKIKKIASMPYI